MLIASYSLWRFQSWIYILFRVYQRKHTIGVWEWERKTTNIFNMAELFKTACTTIHQGIRKLNFHTHWFPHSGFRYYDFLWFSIFALPYLCNVFVYWFGLSLIQFSPCLICISTIVFISYLYVATVYIIYIVASYDWVNHAHIFSILTLWLSQTYIVPQLYVFLCNNFSFFLRIEYFLNLLVKLYLRNKRTFDSQVWSRELPIWKPVEHIPKHSPWEIVCFVCLPSSNHIMYYLLPVLQPSKEGRLATERGEVRLGVFMRQRFYVFLCCLLLNLEKKCRIHTTQMSLFDLYGVFNVQDRTQCSTLNWRPQYLNSKFKSNVCFAKSPRQSIAATSKWVLPKYKYKVKGKKNFYLLKSCIQVLS